MNDDAPCWTRPNLTRSGHPNQTPQYPSDNPRESQNTSLAVQSCSVRRSGSLAEDVSDRGQGNGLCFLAEHFLFVSTRERISLREWMGLALMILSILQSFSIISCLDPVFESGNWWSGIHGATYESLHSRGKCIRLLRVKFCGFLKKEIGRRF